MCDDQQIQMTMADERAMSICRYASLLFWLE